MAFDLLNCLLSLLSVSMYVAQTYYDEVSTRAHVAHLSLNTSVLARAHASRASLLEYAQCIYNGSVMAGARANG